MPTQEQINLLDLNLDKKLDRADVELARALGMENLAKKIEAAWKEKEDETSFTSVMEEAEGRDLSGETINNLAAQTAGPQETSLPSIPSISNVGTISPSGSVNTKSIPGGFQPLPQTAGGRKKLYQMSQFHGGINQKSSPRDISDQECQEATNVSLSRIGRILPMGDCLSTDNSITFAAVGTANIPGYGLFQFNAPADHDGANEGKYTLTITGDGDQIDIHDPADNGQANWLDFASQGDSSATVEQIYYAAGNGLYAGDASLLSNPVCKLWVYRENFGGILETKGWSTSKKPAIDSPTFDTTATDGSVNLGWVDGGVTDFTATSTDGSATVHIGSGSSGNWDGSYFFYISWLFDGKCETGLTSLIASFTDATCDTDHSSGLTDGSSTSVRHITHDDDSGAIQTGYTVFGAGIPEGSYVAAVNNNTTFTLSEDTTATNANTTLTFTKTPRFDDEILFFNFSTKNLDSSASSTNPMGGDERISGARIYFKKDGTSERFMLAEVDLKDGIKGALDSTYISWDGGTSADVYNLPNNLRFTTAPSIYSYSSLNFYFAEEVYSKSSDSLADGTTGPTAHSVRYGTCVVGQRGTVFIGNVVFNGRHMPDAMMFSMPGKPGVFPLFNMFDSPSSDGSPITALASYKDTILQFKENSLFSINVSNPKQFFTEASFRDCGVMNQCQVFSTSFGILFVNKNGVFMFDGSSVTSLTAGKFDWVNQSGISEDTANTSDSAVPSIGYDPRSQNIIVLKNIGDDADTTSATNEGAWIFNMGTQTWTEGSDMITNGNGVRHTNFIISAKGYLSLKSSGGNNLLNFNHTADSAKTITYWTKDMDFGLPQQTKLLFAIYITYRGDASSLTCAYGVDGETDTSDIYHFATDDHGGTTDTTPLLDKSSAANLESWHTARIYPDDSTEGKDWKSISLYLNGSVSTDFEINDISILYRVRPIVKGY